MQDVLNGIVEALMKMSQLGRDEFAPSIETERGIVFNSKLDFVLMRIHREQGLLFGDLRRKDHRLFHQLMAMYIGDLSDKDRLYNPAIYEWDFDKPGFVVEGFVLIAAPGMEWFSASQNQLANILSRIGKVEVSQKGEMDAIESLLNMVDGESPYGFRGTKFIGHVLVKEGCVVSREFKDFIHVGGGYVGRESNRLRSVPREKRKYQGPFLHFVIRGRSERSDKLLARFAELLRVIDDASSKGRKM